MVQTPFSNTNNSYIVDAISFCFKMHFVKMKSIVADSTEIRYNADYTPAGDMLGWFLDGNFDSIPYHKRNLRNILVPLKTLT